MVNFARRTTEIDSSKTMAVTSLVAELRQQGRRVIDLGAGQPDFDTPEPIKQAGIEAIESGYTKYTANSGMLELRQAICDKLQKDNGVHYEPSQIVVSCGAKQAVFNSIMALCDAGDEVIVPQPYWTSYPEMIKFAGARPIFLPTDESQRFKVTAEQLSNYLTDRTKAVILNTPSNPTGAAYSREELSELVQVLSGHPAVVISDEVYEKILYDGRQHVSLASFPEMYDRVLLVNGVSKAYAMTGWRIGYLAGPQAIIDQVAKIQSHSTSNASSVSQKASVTALRLDSSYIREMVQEFDRRRRFLCDRLNAIPRLHCLLPDGAFYLFVDISPYLGAQFKGRRLECASDLCTFLLEEAGVALVPGEAFGSDRHVRISYATSFANLEESLNLIDQALRKLRQGVGLGQPARAERS
jgi:aspartate aminotransferase